MLYLTMPRVLLFNIVSLHYQKAINRNIIRIEYYRFPSFYSATFLNFSFVSTNLLYPSLAFPPSSYRDFKASSCLLSFSLQFFIKTWYGCLSTGLFLSLVTFMVEVVVAGDCGSNRHLRPTNKVSSSDLQSHSSCTSVRHLSTQIKIKSPQCIGALFLLLKAKASEKFLACN